MTRMVVELRLGTEDSIRRSGQTWATRMIFELAPYQRANIYNGPHAASVDFGDGGDYNATFYLNGKMVYDFPIPKKSRRYTTYRFLFDGVYIVLDVKVVKRFDDE